MRPHERLDVWKTSMEILIAHRLDYLTQDAYGTAHDELDQIGRMIHGLSQYLKRKRK